MSRPYRNIVFNFSNSSAAYITPLARILDDVYGIGVVLVCRSRHKLPNRKLFGFDPSAFEKIVEVESCIDRRPISEIPKSGELIGIVQEFESRMPHSLIDMIRADRHMGQDFVTGSKFMRSRFGKDLVYEQSIDIAIRHCAFFESLLSRYQPMAVATTFGTVLGASLYSVAESQRIPIRWLLTARNGERMFWTDSRYCWPCGLREAYAQRVAVMSESGKSNADVPVNIEDTYPAKYFMEQFNRQTRPSFLLKQCLKALRTNLSDRLHGRSEDYGDYTLPSRFSHYTRVWRMRRRISRDRSTPALSSDVPIVFFALHIEPETALMSEASAADNQLTIIDWLSKTVPGGWYVAVKEHPNVTSERPIGFWERISSYPNVVVFPTLFDSQVIAQRSKVVATINGTVGIRAALAGIPVITFHHAYQARLMPHVFFADSFTSTREALQKIANGEIPDRGIRNHAGTAFTSALDDCSFPIDDHGLLIHKAQKSGVDSADVSTLVGSLMETLNIDETADKINTK